MDNEKSILLEQSGPISIPQWEEMVRDIIMFSDHVWIKSSVQIDSILDINIGRHFQGVFNELIEAGLVKLYALESDSREEKSRAKRVISTEEHMRLYDAVIERVKSDNDCFYDSLADPERTSRIVERRNDLWKLGIATILGSDISFTYKNINKNAQKNELLRRSLNAEFITELFVAFDISSLSHLTTYEIIEFQKKARKNHMILEKLVSDISKNPEFDINSVVTKELKDSIEKTNEILSNVSGNKGVKKLILNSAINLAGLVPSLSVLVVPITAIMCGKDFFYYIKNKREYEFIFFMNSLKSTSKKMAK